MAQWERDRHRRRDQTRKFSGRLHNIKSRGRIPILSLVAVDSYWRGIGVGGITNAVRIVSDEHLDWEELLPIDDAYPWEADEFDPFEDYLREPLSFLDMFGENEDVEPPDNFDDDHIWDDEPWY